MKKCRNLRHRQIRYGQREQNLICSQFRDSQEFKMAFYNIGNTLKTVSIDKLAEVCSKYDVLVVPAHFSKNKGLGRINANGIREFADQIPIAAIEVRDESDVQEVENKVQNNVFKLRPALVTGSDNPGPVEGEHAIEGLGKAFTWIKLSEHSLESIRQAFLDPTRIIFNFESNPQQINPNHVTHSYIAGMVINKLKHIVNLDFRFSPHLNCVIGGRGTGKSTIIEMIRMTLDKVDDKKSIKFPLIGDITTEESEVSVYYNFGSAKEFRVTAKGKKKRTWVHEDETGVLQEYPDFPVSVFSQKDIYNLIDDDKDSDKKRKSPILEIIDENIHKEKMLVEAAIDALERKALNLSQELRSLRNELEDIPKIKAEIEVADSKLDLFKNTGIIGKKAKLDEFKNDDLLLENVISDIDGTVKEIDDALSIVIQRHLDDINSKIKQDVSKTACIKFEATLNKFQENLQKAIELAKDDVKTMREILESSLLKGELLAAEQEYNLALENLHGLNIEHYKDTAITKENNTNRLKELYGKESKEREILEKLEQVLNQIEEQKIQLNLLRRHVAKQIQDKAVNIGLNVHFMSHSDRWLTQLRKDLGRVDTFDEEFETLKDWLFPQNIVSKENWRCWNRFLLTFDKGAIAQIKRSSGKPLFVDKFDKVWETKYLDKTLNSLFAIFPEDRVEIKIKNNGNEMGINDGSPGQKCAAILAFILNQGNRPLVIDQPEDDLDNSLIIELIVDNIRKMKWARQIIIVTHNPNIPVLGDAEGIIMLDRDNSGIVNFKDGKKTGCIEEKTIKKGICDIMEGGIVAFKKRETKYKNVEK